VSAASSVEISVECQTKLKPRKRIPYGGHVNRWFLCHGPDPIAAVVSERFVHYTTTTEIDKGKTVSTRVGVMPTAYQYPAIWAILTAAERAGLSRKLPVVNGEFESASALSGVVRAGVSSVWVAATGH
jgi:hypothetical protein